MKRRTRLTLLAPVIVGSLALGSTALAQAPSAPAAVPAATCSLSGVLPDGTVNVSGGGFLPGPAFLEASTGVGAGFSMSPDGTFTIAKQKKDATYSVRQGSTVTRCSGDGTTSAATGTTAKAGIVAGWDAVRANCAATAPASANEQFSQGWTKGAAVAKEAFC
ncbi:hypothetical protein AB0D46_02270 [Streptomyces sp. NPDC048383]|uniref:hypothetical protein n=1 Tax=Streptomyces sp. NPDC048383 TaxID=3155386 RepID=UPI00343835B7